METLETDYTEMQLGRECANICIPRDRFVYTTYDDDGDNTENWLQFSSVVLLCLENDYYPVASLSLSTPSSGMQVYVSIFLAN